MKHKNIFTAARKNMIYAYACLTPTIVFLGLVIGYTMFYLFRLSLSKVSYQKGQMILGWNGLENFKTLLNDANFWGALKHTFHILSISVSLSIILGMILAVCLDKLIHGRNIFRTIILLPFMIAPALSTTMWRVLYDGQFGIINHVLKFLHIIKTSIPWLATPKFAIYTIIICDIWEQTPFCMIILFAGLQDTPDELYDAARVDGASAFQIFSKITLPLIKGYILFVLLIRTLFTLRIFDYVYTLTSGGPANSTEVLATYLYKVATKFVRFDYSATIAMALLLLTIIALLIQFIIFKERKS